MIATIILLTLSAISLGMNLAKHGENKKEDKYNFWASLIASAITITLYYYAGLFDKFSDL